MKISEVEKISDLYRIEREGTMFCNMCGTPISSVASFDQHNSVFGNHLHVCPNWPIYITSLAISLNNRSRGTEE